MSTMVHLSDGEQGEDMSARLMLPKDAWGCVILVPEFEGGGTPWVAKSLARAGLAVLVPELGLEPDDEIWDLGKLRLAEMWLRAQVGFLGLPVGLVAGGGRAGLVMRAAEGGWVVPNVLVLCDGAAAIEEPELETLDLPTLFVGQAGKYLSTELNCAAAEAMHCEAKAVEAHNSGEAARLVAGWLLQHAFSPTFGQSINSEPVHAS